MVNPTTNKIPLPYVLPHVPGYEVSGIDIVAIDRTGHVVEAINPECHKIAFIIWFGNGHNWIVSDGNCFWCINSDVDDPVLQLAEAAGESRFWADGHVPSVYQVREAIAKLMEDAT